MDNIQPGQELGPYRIIGQIGQGGMATVYKAYHAAMDRFVALKILPRQLAENPEFTGRFQQEARTIAKLEHAHILPVHDYGESGGITYLVMRFLDAGTLKDRITAGKLSLTEVDRIFSQLADALDYAHAHGVVHRDLKPSNVLVDSRGNVFLTDFGIAKLLESTSHFTSTGGLIGTPAYMSPEQAEGRKVDQRSDIYSLGIILYELVTGRVPFEAETPLAVVLKHLQEPLPLPSAVKPGVAPAVERVLLKALSKNPDDRFATMGEFLKGWKEAYAEASATAATLAGEASSRAAPSMRADAKGLAGEASSQAAPAAGATAKGLAGEAPGRATAPSTAAAQGVTPTILTGSPAPAGEAQPKRGAGIGVVVAVVGVVAVLLCGSLFGVRLIRQRLARLKETATATASTQIVATLPPAGPSGWTSWTAGNDAEVLLVNGDQLLSGGWGGVTLWNRADGSVLGQYTTANGLPNPHVTALLADEENGNLWLGTEYGVALYNGQKWIDYTDQDGLDSTTISALGWWKEYLVVGTRYSDRDGGGLNLFDGSKWSTLPDFPSANPDDHPDKLANNINYVLTDSDGALWVATANGLGRYDGQAWTRYSTVDGLPSNDVVTLFVDDEDTLWAGTRGGAARFNGETFEAAEQGPPDGVYGIVQDSDGQYWFSGGGGVWRYDPANADWQEYTGQTGDMPTYGMYGATTDSDGNLYFGSDGGGVVQYDGNFHVWQVPNVPAVAAFGHIVPAPHNQLWFVEEYGGRVDTFDLASGQWAPLPEQKCDCVPLFFAPDGTMYGWQWNGGLWIVNGNKLTQVSTAAGLPEEDEVITAVAAADGTVWIGTDQGLARYDGQSVVEILTTDNAGFASDEVRALLAAADGSLWVGLDGGLSHLQPNGQWEHFTVGAPFSDNFGAVNDLAEDATGAIWVATRGDGAYRYAGGEWKNFLPNQPGVDLPSDSLNSVTVAPDGSVWFGTYYSGAARFDGNDWQIFSIEEGLMNWNANDIYVDGAGTVWFATSGGVTRYIP